jgi:hypothetical protein
VRPPTSSRWLLGLATSIAWSAACYPGEPTAAAELDVVATTHDDTVDFSTIGTFVLPDSVVEIVPPESVGTTPPLNHAYDQLILDGVAAKLTGLGYTRLSTFEAGNPPDVAVLVKGIAVRNTDVYVTYPWYDYWGWYGWPPYGPGWGVGYPVVSDVVQYDVGTIVVDMWDIRRADPPHSAGCSLTHRRTPPPALPRPSIGPLRSHPTSALSSRGAYAMRTTRRIMGLLLLLLLSGTLTAEAQLWNSLTYQPAQPLSNTESFTEGFSWRGLGYDIKKFVKPNLAMGLSFGWHSFDQQTDEVVSAFGIDVSGDQFRYVNSFPILVNGSYFFGSPGRLRPYLSANIGVYIMEHRMDVGLYSLHETNVHFGLAPEAGIAFPVRENLAAVLNSRYNYAFSAGSVEDQSYVTFGIGLAWAKGF